VKFDKFIQQLKSKKAALAILVDPDKFSEEVIRLSKKNNAACFLIGGSKLKKNNISEVIKKIKKISSLPVIIFPGDEKQISKEADGMLMLSLISGRNPEYLIGKHVKAAEEIKRSKIKTIPVAYILIKGGKTSTTQKITATQALDPANIKAIKNTSIAGELLGAKAIYLEAGSGAVNSIPTKIVKEVKKNISVPLIAGGGIDSFEKANAFVKAGADMVVIGNALEREPLLIIEIGKAFN
jgi:phosphoglycerol geranylgeranyltransferase